MVIWSTRPLTGGDGSITPSVGWADGEGTVRRNRPVGRLKKG